MGENEMEITEERILRFGVNDEFGGIYVKLTSEEEKAIKEFHGGEEVTQITSVYMIPLKFIDPSRISAYECKKCNKIYEESPKTTVEIRYKSSIKHGKFETSIVYCCNHCEDDPLVYGGHSEKPEIIPKQFIVYDETGKFKTPTPESIEDLFTKTFEDSKKGQGNINHPLYKNNLEIINRWCEKINYKIPQERIEELEQTWKTSYIKNLKDFLPKAILKIKKQSIVLECAQHLDDEIDHIGESGIIDYLDTIDQALELNIVPEEHDLKIDILKTLLMQAEVPRERIMRYEEKKDKIDKEIEKERRYADNLIKKVNNFVNQAGLKYENIREAQNKHWPESNI